MKTKYIIMPAVLCSLMIVGCQDMDTVPEGSYLTDKQKEEVAAMQPEKAQAQVNAVFASFSQYFPNASALGTERHNDFGYPTIMLAMGTNGDTEVSDNNGYNWMGYSIDYTDHSDYSSNECQMVWNDLYAIIYAANNVVKNIDADSDDANNKYYLSQGYAARGFAYWVLAQLYQFNYVGNQTKPCVPLITEANVEDATVNGCPVSTVEAVYKQIDSDLQMAVDLLKEAKEGKVTRSDKRYISLAVAYGLQARMYLSMQNWAAAAAAADNAIKEAAAEKISIASVTKPAFSSVDEVNWMWGIIVNETDAIVDSGICNWPSHMGSLSYGYANFSGGRQISRKLYTKIQDTDERKRWWLDATGAPFNDNEADYLTSEAIAFIAENSYKPYTQMKFGPYNDVVGTAINANDIPLMRIEEMYLIKAEATGMNGGNWSAGKTELISFIKNHDPNYNPTSVTNVETFQEEVYTQRAIELWGEGMNWFDVMRMNRGVDRTGCGFPNPSSVVVIPPTENILLWRIPEAEIQANKALSNDDSPAPTRTYQSYIVSE